MNRYLDDNMLYFIMFIVFIMMLYKPRAKNNDRTMDVIEQRYSMPRFATNWMKL